jgi:transposase-like protein
LLRKLLKRQCRSPGVMITDKLPSYGAATREIMPAVEHRQHNRLNNRAENSHQPTRRRERIMKRFKSAGLARASSPFAIKSETSSTVPSISAPPIIASPKRGPSRPGPRWLALLRASDRLIP